MKTVTGLGAELDELISSLPEEQFYLPERKAYRHSPFATDSEKVIADLRGRGGVIPVIDGKCGQYELPNTYGHDDSKPRFLVTGFDACSAILGDAKNFTASRGAEFERTIGQPLPVLDKPDHTRVRKLLNKAFSKGSMNELHDAVVRPIAKFLVARAAERIRRGEVVEFMRDISIPMSFLVISEMLGIPRRHLGDLVVWSSDFFVLDSPEKMRKAVGEVTKIFEEELAKRRVEPQDDMIGWLAAVSDEGDTLTDEEILVNGRFLIPAGVDTTSRQLAMMVHVLLDDRSRYEQVVDNPDLVSPAVDEVLRWMPIQLVGSAPRIAIEDVTIEGVTIPKGSSLTVAPGIINRDESRWERPDEFDIHRDLKPTVTFGRGFHLCIGMHLARLEMVVLLEELTAQLPDLTLADPAAIEILGLTVRQPARGMRVTTE